MLQANWRGLTDLLANLILTLVSVVIDFIVNPNDSCAGVTTPCSFQLLTQ